jgi:hypothetical protein
MTVGGPALLTLALYPFSIWVILSVEILPMSLDISTQTEALLVAKARQQGLSVEALLRRLLYETPDTETQPKLVELPHWNLGVKSSLRREDFYDDVG